MATFFMADSALTSALQSQCADWDNGLDDAVSWRIPSGAWCDPVNQVPGAVVVGEQLSFDLFVTDGCEVRA
jgi:hypothetical protein